MADLMNVYKLDQDEVGAIRKMAMMWLEDGNIEEHSGWNPKTIARAIENLPYVEPDHQPMVEDMVDFFYDFEDIFSDRVIESLQRVFG
jgi:hypothetical protein